MTKQTLADAWVQRLKETPPQITQEPPSGIPRAWQEALAEAMENEEAKQSPLSDAP